MTRLTFYDWSAARLSKTRDSRPMPNWQARPSVRAKWIIILARIEAQETGSHPKAFRLARYGETIAEGEIDWSDPTRPFVTYGTIATCPRKPACRGCPDCLGIINPGPVY